MQHMPRVFEESAGGIVYKKTEKGFRFLVLKWRNSQNHVLYTIPKGHIENNETPIEAALREISEETGLQQRFFEVIKFIKKISFSFTARHLEGNPTVDKDVHVFLVKYTGTFNPRVQRKERFVGYDWVEMKDLKKLNMKPNISEIVQANKGFLE